MNKILNTDAIQNDLEESAFFRQRKNDSVLPVPRTGGTKDYPYPSSSE